MNFSFLSPIFLSEKNKFSKEVKSCFLIVQFLYPYFYLLFKNENITTHYEYVSERVVCTENRYN